MTTYTSLPVQPQSSASALHFSLALQPQPRSSATLFPQPSILCRRLWNSLAFSYTGYEHVQRHRWTTVAQLLLSICFEFLFILYMFRVSMFWVIVLEQLSSNTSLTKNCTEHVHVKTWRLHLSSYRLANYQLINLLAIFSFTFSFIGSGGLSSGAVRAQVLVVMMASRCKAHYQKTYNSYRIYDLLFITNVLNTI